ncbi:hypothetical protein X975_07125, partial [Stegodyphus mimosarum]
MSWFGEQFSSITEKLTDFTKEVLTEKEETALTEDLSNQNGILSQKELIHLCKEKDEKIEFLLNEKVSLEQSMEELDRQHQEAIDELLHLKNEVVKENSELKEKVKCFLEKTDYSSQDCFLNKNLPSVQTDHIFFESISSDITSIEKQLNLLSLFHDLRCSSNKDRLNDILKWLRCQKETLEVQQSIEN